MLRYFTFNTITELICFLIAFVCLIKDKNLAWRGLVLFLLITCIIEMIGIYIKHLYHAEQDYIKFHPGLVPHVRSNNWIYNILMLFEAGFTSLMFATLFSKYFNSKLIIVSGLALLLIIYSYEILTDGVFKKHNITTTAMAILFVLYSLLYFYYLIKDESYINLKYYPPFWWVVGCLFFYFGSTACNIFYDKLSGVMIAPKHYLTTYIFKALNLILYGCWSYSFICKKWLTKTLKA